MRIKNHYTSLFFLSLTFAFSTKSFSSENTTTTKTQEEQPSLAKRIAIVAEKIQAATKDTANDAQETVGPEVNNTYQKIKDAAKDVWQEAKSSRLIKKAESTTE